MSTWDLYKESLAKGISETPERLNRSVDQQDNTLSEMGKVAKNWHTSWKQAIEGPKKVKGAPPLRPDQKAAQAVRRVQQVVGAVVGLLNLGKDMLDMGFASVTAPIAALFPSLPAATIGSMYIGIPHAHAHPPSLIPPAPPVPLPSLGPVTLGTCVRVLICGMPAARCGDIGLAPTCGGFFPFFQIKTGSSNTFIGGNRAARITDFCTACSQAQDDRKIEAGKFLAAVGAAARVASSTIAGAALIGGALGVAADMSEAAAEDDAAMASAKALAAGMGAAQMAADLAAKALSKLMGKDPGIPPGGIGAIVAPTQGTVLIGGFPMVNIPNPVDLILGKLKRYTGRKPKTRSGNGKTQPSNCPQGS